MSKKEKEIKRLKSLQKRFDDPELKEHYQRHIEKLKKEDENT